MFLGGASVALADLPPPRAAVTAADTPDCVTLIDADFDGPITVANDCDDPLTLGNVAKAIQNDQFRPVEDGAFILEPGASARVGAPYGEDLTWSLPDGRMGTIVLEYSVSDVEHGCHGCDASNGWGSAPLLAWALLSLCLVRRRRGNRQA